LVLSLVPFGNTFNAEWSLKCGSNTPESANLRRKYFWFRSGAILRLFHLEMLMKTITLIAAASILPATLAAPTGDEPSSSNPIHQPWRQIDKLDHVDCCYSIPGISQVRISFNFLLESR
jgi:hypothetical protein